jgi:hypothetical protein
MPQGKGTYGSKRGRPPKKKGKRIGGWGELMPQMRAMSVLQQFVSAPLTLRKRPKKDQYGIYSKKK